MSAWSAASPRCRAFARTSSTSAWAWSARNRRVEESGAPILLVVRLKVVDNKLTEIELVPTRSRADGLIFNLDGLKAASEVMNYAPRADELATREQVLAAALKYPEGFIKARRLSPR